METKINIFSQMYLYAKGWFDENHTSLPKYWIERFIVAEYSGINPEDVTDNMFNNILLYATREYLSAFSSGGITILENAISDLVSYAAFLKGYNMKTELPSDPIDAHMYIMKTARLNILRHANVKYIEGNLAKPMNVSKMWIDMQVRIHQ